MTTDALRKPPLQHRLPPTTPLALILEFTVVMIIAFSATVQFLDSNPYTVLPGSEAEWLTNSAYLASSALQEYGYIPRWQPWLGFGEPLIDNPFSFVMNPVSIYPSLLNGGVVGIKVSVALTAIVAGLGGWVLGRVLGFGSLARLLLAVLCIGKGNMYALIGNGYFQLGTSQAYMPWVIAGTLGILRFRRARWPVILTVVMFTLMFWAGNIWYTLPILVSMALLVAFHMLHVQLPEVNQGSPFRLKVSIDYALLRRVVFAACLTLCLSAITFVPIFLNQGYIGGHPRDVAPTPTVDLGTVIVNYFDGDLDHLNERMGFYAATHYYSFVLPFWFAVLIFLLLPPISPLLHQPNQARGWQVWITALMMIVGCTLWGAGGDPVFTWLYQVIPFLGNWRFVGRALAVASFWIAVLAAMRLDGLWRAVVLSDRWLTTRPLARIVRLNKNLGGRLHIGAAVLLIGTTLVVASQVTAMWHVLAAPGEMRLYDDICISWLRAQNPGQELAVWGTNYLAMITYQKNKVRHQDIEADFKPQPIPSTLFGGNLTTLLPEYGIAWDNGTRQYYIEQGYQPVLNSPRPVDSHNCLYQKKTGVLPYAFSVAQPALDRYTGTLPESAVVPVTHFARYPDQIALVVDADPSTRLAVSVQELAYPGWYVTINGAPAQLESLGGLIAAVLQPGTGTNTIYFRFQPPLLIVGGIITLFAWVICVAYLLRLERFFPKRIRKLPRLFTRAAAAIWAFLLDPRVLEKKDEPGDDKPAPNNNAAAQDG
jgi:hypothetical protein